MSEVEQRIMEFINRSTTVVLNVSRIAPNDVWGEQDGWRVLIAPDPDARQRASVVIADEQGDHAEFSADGETVEDALLAALALAEKVKAA